jgi:hypothetical protein
MLTNNRWRATCERLIRENDINSELVEQEAKKRLSQQRGKNVPLPEECPTPEQRVVEAMEILGVLLHDNQEDLTIVRKHLMEALVHLFELDRYFKFGEKPTK